MHVEKIEIMERDVISDKPFQLVFKYGDRITVKPFESKADRDREFNIFLLQFNLQRRI